MGVAVRKSITIPKEDFEIIDRYRKSYGKSFSEFLRFATKEYIKIQGEMDLKNFLLTHCEYASKEEEEDILRIIKDFDPLDSGRKIKINDLLWSNFPKKSWKMVERK